MAHSVYPETSVVSYYTAEMSRDLVIAARQTMTRFHHINNAWMKSRIQSVIEAWGYECPVICSPEELGVNEK